MSQTHHRDCHLCEACCSLVIETEGEKILSIKGDPAAALSKGHFCTKALALQSLHEDPDRLRHPIKRVGDSWEKISWKEAFVEIADKLVSIQEQHGNNAVGLYLGNPTVHSYGAVLYGLGFRQSLRTRNCFSATSADQLPSMFTSLLMYGHQLMLPVPDVDRTDYFLILGANPIASGGSLMTAPGIGRRIKAIQKRGGKVVVIDPRRTETAIVASQHHFIRPGSDAYLLASMLNVLFEEKWTDIGRLQEDCKGLEFLPSLFRPYTPESVQNMTGISAQDIRQLTREFSEAKSAVAYGRLGTCTQSFGGLTTWMINLLNVLTGNLDAPGGMMFTAPAFDMVKNLASAGHTGSFNKRQSRVSGLPEFGGEFPSVAMAEEMTTPGAGQIRALVTFAGNPALSTSNGKVLDKALSELDFMVSIDIYLNETTRHASIILPPVSPLERDNYDVVFLALAVQNFAKYSPALFEAPKNGKHDWQILNSLETHIKKRRAGGMALSASLKGSVMNRLGPQNILDLGLKWASHQRRKSSRPKLSLERLKKEPHGIDLGPLEPCLPEGLYHEDGKIDLCPTPMVVDLDRLELQFTQASLPTNGRALALIGRRHVRDNNSWLHNQESLMKGTSRCTLFMNPDDAKQRALVTGQMVEIRSSTGAVQAPLNVTSTVMAGVVSLPHGYGHHGKGTRQGIANKNAGVSMNDLTDTGAIDRLTGNAVLNGIEVDVIAVQ